MIITHSNGMPAWLEKHLNGESAPKNSFPGFLRLSSFDEDPLPSAEEAAADPELQKGFVEIFDQMAADAEERKRQMTTPLWAGGKIPRARGVGDAAKNRINKKIYALTKGFKDEIPIKGMLEACETEGLVPLDDDNTRLSGIMLVGGGECGSEQSRSQQATIRMAVRLPDGSYAPATTSLHLSWCKMGGQYEITAYYG